MKTFRTFYITFVAIILSCPELFSQQRNDLQLKMIVDELQQSFQKKHQLQEKISSSSLFKEYGMCAEKEAFYIFRSQDKEDKAFVIVSADSRMPAILAYSENNSFDIDNIPPAVNYWLETYVISSDNAIAALSESLSASELPYMYDGVAPLLEKTSWGQSKPFNNLCPVIRGETTLTGCVATAMAQVMRYYSFPAQAQGHTTYRTTTNKLTVAHDFTKDVFDWSNMLDSYTGSYSNAQADAVAVLMASCGASVKMDYGTTNQGGSGAYQSDLIKGYIENFGYDKDAALVIRNYCSTEDWHRLLLTELNEGRPVNYGGVSMRDGGHSFVLDGYRLGNNEYPDYHVNWGWDGSCDGYYQIANLLPQDNGNAVMSAPFSNSQQMTIRVKPDDGVNDDCYVLVSSKINSSLTKVREHGTVTFNVSSVYNCSFKKFTGFVSVALKDENNQLFVLSTGNKYQMEYMEGTTGMNLTCNIPSTIKKGKYQVCLVSQAFGSSGWNEAFSSSYPILEVTENEQESSAEEETWSEIGCIEVELVQEADKRKLSANVYGLINLQEESFTGNLSFALADENGSFMFLFGEKTDVPELGYHDFLTNHLCISGTIEQEIPDGHYRLYVSAQMQEKATGSYVVQYDLDVLDAPKKELYFKVEVKNGIAYIDGKEYEVNPTGIDAAKEHLSKRNNLYTIGGQRASARKHKGIYIQQSNGITKKIVTTH